MTNIKIITKKELLLNGMIPNQKKKVETFENEFNKLLILHQKSQICIRDLLYIKQLHDKEIKELKSKLRTCICFKCGSKAINENGFCLDCGCYQ